MPAVRINRNTEPRRTARAAAEFTGVVRDRDGVPRNGDITGPEGLQAPAATDDPAKTKVAPMAPNSMSCSMFHPLGLKLP
jgi:hypothetical protein